MNGSQNLLHELAQVCRVQTSYDTMTGERKLASPEALAATLEALGFETGTERQLRDSLRRRKEAIWKRSVFPVEVAWNRNPIPIRFHSESRVASRLIQCRLRSADGGEQVFSFKPGQQTRLETTQFDRRSYVASQVILPPLPFGYHELEFESGDQCTRSLVISAPKKGFSRPGIREWGVFLPMYAARSRDNWGTGNLADWRQLCDWISSLGGTIAGSLPLLAAFLDHPTCDPSPYSPASRLFWNEFYLDVTAIPEFQQSAAAQKLFHAPPFQKQLQRFRNSRLVNYRAEWPMRRKLLEILAREFFASSSPRGLEFEAFLRSRPEVRNYAAFRAACDQTGSSWHTWPKRMRSGELRDRDFDKGVRDFHLYIQWQAQQQIDELLRHRRSRGIQFYLDLPLGVHPDGYDVWRERDHFALQANAGAPPDSFFTRGQNWGFAPLHPERIREQGYRHVLDYLRFQMRHTGLLRIDHVMGLHRLYWIPRGFPADEGVYVRYEAEELHAILSLESHRHKTVLVGENLGTVPPEVNEAMDRHGMRGMFVAQYQQRPDSSAALSEPSKATVASVNTHDIPTFAAHWKGLEILDHAKLGLISPAEIRPKGAERRKLNRALTAFLRSQRLLRGKGSLRSSLEALLVWLGRGEAEIVLVNLEDLLLEEQPQNVPGTYRERPNWQRKSRLTLEQIRQDPRTLRALKRLAKSRSNNARQKTRRS